MTTSCNRLNMPIFQRLYISKCDEISFNWNVECEMLKY